MNIENIDKTIAMLKKVKIDEKTHYDQSTYADQGMRDALNKGLSSFESMECGTTGCIAGWAAASMVENGEVKFDLTAGASFRGVSYYASDIPNLAAHWLDLSYNQRDDLFLGPHHCGYSSVTIDDAVRVLEYLKETGKVDWEYAMCERWD